jgi:protein CMS1
MTRGDDLDDDFVLDDLVALSGEEGDDHEEGFHSEASGEGRELMTERGEEPEGALKGRAAAGKKRKLREKAKMRKAKVCTTLHMHQIYSECAAEKKISQRSGFF